MFQLFIFFLTGTVTSDFSFNISAYANRGESGGGGGGWEFGR